MRMCNIIKHNKSTITKRPVRINNIRKPIYMLWKIAWTLKTTEWDRVV